MSDRAKHWQRLVSAWEKSGLSQAEFCRRRGIKCVNFGWWKRKLNGAAGRRRQRRRRDSTAGGRRGRAGFVEVALPRGVLPAGSVIPISSCTCPPSYEIVLPDGSLIRLPGNFDPEKVSQLIHAVVLAC